jgi:hypothetical protein
MNNEPTGSRSAGGQSRIQFPNNLHTFPRFIEITLKELSVKNNVPTTYSSSTTKGMNAGAGNIVKAAGSGLMEGFSRGGEEMMAVSNLDYEEKIKAHIYLPLPNNLSTDFTANWNGSPLSPLEFAIREWAQNGQDWSVFGQALGRRMALSTATLAATKGAGKVGVAGGTVQAGGNSLLKGAGIVLNPYQQLQYTGPNFRTFAFDWVLSPSNAAESETIRHITWAFKKYMHTSSSVKDMFFAFPAYCEVKFVDASSKDQPFLFAMRKSAITRVSVSYERKFHKDGSSIATRLGVDFLESVILTQDDFGEVYQPASSGKMDLLSEHEMQQKQNPTSKS